MKLKSKRILVTGADGFIGSHLTEHLVKQGLDVRAFCLYNSFGSHGWLDTLDPKIRRSMDFFLGDVRDPHGVKTAMKGCDVVFHLAALIGIPYSYVSPDSYVDTNIRGTLNIVQAARELGVKKVVITSTSEVYGTARFVPITEEHPLQGQSPYSATKIGADQLALSFHTSFNTPVAVARPFNTYGPRQSTRAVIPTIITQIAAGARKIKLGSVHPTRDFNYVKDVARGFAAVAESDKTTGQVVNLGSNFEVSIKETVELIAECMKVKLSIQSEDLRKRPAKSEVERLWADNSKALALAGWKPEYGGREGFKQGLLETIRWFKDPENLKRYNTSGYQV